MQPRWQEAAEDKSGIQSEASVAALRLHHQLLRIWNDVSQTELIHVNRTNARCGDGQAFDSNYFYLFGKKEKKKKNMHMPLHAPLWTPNTFDDCC